MYKILCLCFGLCLAAAATAQDEYVTITDGGSTSIQDDDASTGIGRVGQQENYYSNSLFVGVKAGATFSTMSGEPDETDLSDGSGIGFSAGVVGRLRFGSGNLGAGSGLFGLQVELKYKLHTLKTLGSDDLSLSYFEVPVLVQFYPFYNSTSSILGNIYVEGGVAMAASLSSSPDVLTVQPETGTYYAYSTGDLKGFDVRPAIGLGVSIPVGKAGSDYHVTNAFDINLRYYIGTSELAENFPVKVNALELSLAWYFNVMKF